jgi:hypothetical protein
MSIFSVINATSKTVGQFRDETSVMMHVMEEVGELALELAIHNGTSYKTAGPDGVIGEAMDSIICLMDLIYCHKPDITETELEEIAIKKCLKWRTKAEGVIPKLG